LAPYTRPRVEMAVASQVSPTGARAAGKHGLGLLSIGATTAGGFNALASNWAICEEMARANGISVSRDKWRLVGPIHVAATREQAREDVRFGLEKWLFYFREVAALALAPAAGGDPIDAIVASGMAAIGTPDDCIAQLERLAQQSGGFGCFLLLAHNWANWEATRNSYDMIARYVMPHFQGSNLNRVQSLEHARVNYADLVGQQKVAIGARIAQHIAERGDEHIQPEVLQALEAEVRATQAHAKGTNGKG
jgi:limonene 1,2-monooxygenase